MSKFLLVDDHAIVRSGIKALIRDAMNTAEIFEAENAAEFLRITATETFDVILLDINMPDTDFPALLATISEKAGIEKVLVFTAHTENVLGVRCIQAGVGGFVNKGSSNSEILQAIQQILAGRKYITPALGELLLANTVTQNADDPFSVLSPREMEIAILLNRGISLPGVAEQLKISYSTANTYKRRIFEKLQIDNIFSLARLMKTYGIDE